jgi:tRNA(fMet)-specific endonuclease VapC
VKYLLDTNACIDILRLGAKSLVHQRVRKCAAHEVCLSSVVRMELVFGALRSRDPQHGLYIIDEMFAGFHSLDFDNKAADRCADIRVQLEKRGTPIGTCDAMIASIAQSRGLEVVANNTKEFTRVANLEVEDWSQP